MGHLRRGFFYIMTYFRGENQRELGVKRGNSTGFRQEKRGRPRGRPGRLVSVTLPYGGICPLRGRGKRRGQAPALRGWGSLGDLGIMGQACWRYVAGGSVTLPYGVVCALRGRGRRRGQEPALRGWGSLGGFGNWDYGNDVPPPGGGGTGVIFVRFQWR